MSRRALVIGIDHYSPPLAKLSGCVGDATAMTKYIETNGDGSPNFAVKCLTSEAGDVCITDFDRELDWLFRDAAHVALLYFAGHGLIHESTDAGYLATQDGQKGAWGIRFADIMGRANTAFEERKIHSTIIIIDACNSGALGEVNRGQGNSSQLGRGVTVITAASKGEAAKEREGNGIFTRLLLEGLDGGAADVAGRITPASLYAFVDRSLSAVNQRPVYKANVHEFINLRQVKPRVAIETIRDLPKWFSKPDAIYPLGPWNEPDRDSFAEKYKDIPVDPEKERVYRLLQGCVAAGLVEPTDATRPFMWQASMEKKGCKLTSLGRHFLNLAEKKYI